jgi:hypothetical protein
MLWNKFLELLLPILNQIEPGSWQRDGDGFGVLAMLKNGTIEPGDVGRLCKLQCIVRQIPWWRLTDCSLCKTDMINSTKWWSGESCRFGQPFTILCCIAWQRLCICWYEEMSSYSLWNCRSCIILFYFETGASALCLCYQFDDKEIGGTRSSIWTFRLKKGPQFGQKNSSTAVTLCASPTTPHKWWPLETNVQVPQEKGMPTFDTLCFNQQKSSLCREL